MAIENNSVVSIEYSVKDASNNVEVDSNVNGEPLEFIVGQQQIIPGLENELVKLNKNDEANIQVNPEDGYGEYNEEAVQTLPKEQFAGVELSEGMSLYGTGEDGQTIQVTVKSFTDEDVTIDYNHPLAGKTLMFTVKILDVRDATQEEIQTGVVGGLQEEDSCGCGGGHCH